MNIAVVGCTGKLGSTISAAVTKPEFTPEI